MKLKRFANNLGIIGMLAAGSAAGTSAAYAQNKPDSSKINLCIPKYDGKWLLAPKAKYGTLENCADYGNRATQDASSRAQIYIIGCPEICPSNKRYVDSVAKSINARDTRLDRRMTYLNSRTNSLGAKVHSLDSQIDSLRTYVRDSLQVYTKATPVEPRKTEATIEIAKPYVSQDTAKTVYAPKGLRNVTSDTTIKPPYAPTPQDTAKKNLVGPRIPPVMSTQPSHPSAPQSPTRASPTRNIEARRTEGRKTDHLAMGLEFIAGTNNELAAGTYADFGLTPWAKLELFGSYALQQEDAYLVDETKQVTQNEIKLIGPDLYRNKLDSLITKTNRQGIAEAGAGIVISPTSWFDIIATGAVRYSEQIKTKYGSSTIGFEKYGQSFGDPQTINKTLEDSTNAYPFLLRVGARVQPLRRIPVNLSATYNRIGKQNVLKGGIGFKF